MYGMCSSGAVSTLCACIEVVHQEQLVISWHRVECVFEDLVELLLILLWEGCRRGVCADEVEVGVACQWDVHGHRPVADPFWKGFKFGDENCADGEANTGLPGFIGCPATPEESVASTDLR